MVKLLVFVVPLAFDTLALALALGFRGIGPFRPALTFMVFEAAMPLVGLFIGYFAGARIETPAVVLGGIVLIAVGAHIAKEATEDEDETSGVSFASLRTSIAAGFGISMDELTIGFPMGTSGLPLVSVIAAIAVQAFVVTFSGVLLGRHLGARFERRASSMARIIAGVAFVLLGVYLIAQRFVRWLPQL